MKPFVSSGFHTCSEPLIDIVNELDGESLIVSVAVMLRDCDSESELESVRV